MIMPQTLDMIPHPLKLSSHWIDSVSLSVKRMQLVLFVTTLVYRGPGSLPLELPGPVRKIVN